MKRIAMNLGMNHDYPVSAWSGTFPLLLRF